MAASTWMWIGIRPASRSSLTCRYLSFANVPSRKAPEAIPATMKASRVAALSSIICDFFGFWCSVFVCYFAFERFVEFDFFDAVCSVEGFNSFYAVADSMSFRSESWRSAR